MKLYKENGTNPLASCLPIILQAPIFFALFRVLNGLAPPAAADPPRRPQGHQADLGARRRTLFGAPMSATFIGAGDLHTSRSSVALIIVAMSATTFITQRQLMSKNMPADAMNNPFAQQQKILLYVFPLIFAVFGVNFPIGVLLYWLTTNLWSMGQQFYVIRRNPTPGSPAALALRAAQGGEGGRPRPARRQRDRSRSGRRPCPGWRYHRRGDGYRCERRPAARRPAAAAQAQQEEARPQRTVGGSRRTAPPLPGSSPPAET